VTEPIPLPSPLPRLVVGADLRLEVWRAEWVEEVLGLIEHSRDTLASFLPWAAEPVTVQTETAIQADAEDRWRRGLMVPWAVIEGDEIKGMLGMHRRGGPDELEIGYWLDDRATGRGLMTRACELATDVAFAVDGVEVVEITHDVRNHRSGAVPDRLGYARTAAFTSPPQARMESGIKVRWCAWRRSWLARPRPSSVVRAE
jgi:RimJ/RimL family protein N-acetyltransferase